jgi:hypothetical protein
MSKPFVFCSQEFLDCFVVVLQRKDDCTHLLQEVLGAREIDCQLAA